LYVLVRTESRLIEFDQAKEPGESKRGDPEALSRKGEQSCGRGRATRRTFIVARPRDAANRLEHTRVDHDGGNLRCECWSGGDVVYVVRLTGGVDYVHEILNHTKDKEKRNAQADH